MLEIDIPGFGQVKFIYLVSDFTGTLSIDGRLLPEVKEQLQNIREFLNVHIVTADTFGTVQKQLQDLNCKIKLLSLDNEDVQKEQYIQKLGTEQVIAIGNGNNDRRMLKAARLGIAVIEEEGASSQAITAATIVVKSINDALDLLLNPKRCRATLRF